MQLKRIFFEDLDKNHADLILKLRTMGITQKEFFQHTVKAFINDDPALRDYFESLVQEKTRLGKKPIGKVTSALRVGRTKASQLGLTEKEKSDIFDILELENFDT